MTRRARYAAALIAREKTIAEERNAAQDRIIAALQEALICLLAELLLNLRRKITEQGGVERVDRLIALARAALTLAEGTQK
jgi:hypothetical protein